MSRQHSARAQQFARVYRLLTELAGKAGPSDPEVTRLYHEACELVCELEHGAPTEHPVTSLPFAHALEVGA